jgi:hypothetical protein
MDARTPSTICLCLVDEVSFNIPGEEETTRAMMVESQWKKKKCIYLGVVKKYWLYVNGHMFVRPG